MSVSAPASDDDEGGTLRRELRFWEAIALSIAIMAPTAAMALNGTVPASLVGRAVPLAFIFATVGVIFVSWAFIRLTGYFSHAGSVYAFSGVTLGPRAGFFSGRALLGTYKNIEGTTFPYDRFPFVVGAWLVIGLAITVGFPGLTRNIGARLAAREGLVQES